MTRGSTPQPGIELTYSLRGPTVEHRLAWLKRGCVVGGFVFCVRCLRQLI